jgi:hypothetical protein
MPAERLVHHLQRDPLGAARNFWDYRSLICLLLRYYSRLGSSDAVQRRAEGVEVRQFTDGTARTAHRLAHHLQRDPLGAVRIFGTTGA